MISSRRKYINRITTVEAVANRESLFAVDDWRGGYTFNLTLSFDILDDYVEEFLDLVEIVYQDPDTDIFYRLGIADRHINQEKQSVYLLVYPIEPTELRFAGLCRDRRDFYFVLFDSWAGFYRDESGDPAGCLRGKIILDNLLQLAERNGAPPASIFEQAADEYLPPADEYGLKRLSALLTFIRYKGRYQRYFSRPFEALLDRLRQPLLIAKVLLSYLSPRFRRVAHLRLRKAMRPATAVIESDSDNYWLYATPVFLQGGFLRERDNDLLAPLFTSAMGGVFVDDGVFRYGAAGPPRISEKGSYLGRFPIKIPLRLLGPSAVNPEPGDVAIGLGDYLNLYWWDFGLLRPVTPENIEQLIKRNKERRRISKFGKRYPHIDRGKRYKKEDNE
ncbi:MAG: hypothetical protein GY771_16340 [bacterium]|nr:hypothetical protein [bacterium]